MVVEDDRSSRNALLALLRREGFDGVAAGTVAEAIAVLDGRTPCAIVLDLMLPDGNGSEVLEHVRGGNLPVRVAVATGAADWRAMVDDARLKPDAVFIKPIDFPRLLKWLDAACPPGSAPSLT